MITASIYHEKCPMHVEMAARFDQSGFEYRLSRLPDPLDTILTAIEL